MVSIIEAIPQQGQSLFVKFDDGVSGRIHLAEILPDAPLTRPLRDNDFFAQVRLYPGGDGVFWPNDFDLAADMLHNVLKAELVH